MNIGARIIKTGIAVSLAIFFSELLQLPNAAFAGIAAFLAIQPSVFRSFKHLFEQIQANVVGALSAILALYTIGNDPIVIGVIVVILIAINKRAGVSNIGISILSAIAILEIPQDDFIFFAMDRFLAILIGILSSIVLNVIFMPPKYEDKLLHHVETTSEHLSVILRSLVSGELEKKAYKKAKEEAEKNIRQAKELFSLYQDEYHQILKHYSYSKAKKLIIFKQMISMIDKEFEVIVSFEENKKTIHSLDSFSKELFHHYLLTLTTFDEKIFMRFEGKIKCSYRNDSLSEIEHYKNKLLDFVSNNARNISILSAATSLFELGESLERLSVLVENIKKTKEEK